MLALRCSFLIRSSLLRNRTMAISNGGTHPERTSSSYRSNSLLEVEVSDITKLSPTVKGYELALKEATPTITFKAGQWLDVHIPNRDNVIGGYSLTCSPNLFDQSGKLTLAIQYSDHPPTHWMHTQCKIGSVFKIRVGGDFFYDSTPSTPVDLLLIAGGIGINPIYSILQHQVSLLKGQGDTSPQTHLLYSARNLEELIFKDNIDRLRYGCHSMSAKYFVTREDNHVPDIINRRIQEDDFRKTLAYFSQEQSLKCYICGPPPFINEIMYVLQKLGLQDHQLHFEKWW